MIERGVNVDEITWLSKPKKFRIKNFMLNVSYFKWVTFMCKLPKSVIK